MGQSSSVGPGWRPVAVDGLEGEQLDGLAQAHVVGQAGAQPERGEERQPGDAALLVGPQLRGERGGRLDRGQRPVRGAGEQVAEPPGRVDAGQRQGQVVGRAARGEREHVGGRRRPAVAPAEELEAAAQRGLVHAHPGPAQPHQRGLRGDEGGDLLLVESGVGAVADGQRPAEGSDLLAAQPAAHDDALRGGAAGGQPQPDPAGAVPAGGQLHREPGVDEQRGAGDEHVVGALRAQVEPVGAGGLERGGERRVDAGGPAELGEQHLLRVCDQPVRRTGPHLRRADEQAGVAAGLQEELQPPARAVAGVVLFLGQGPDLGEPETRAGGAGRLGADGVPRLQGLGQRAERRAGGQPVVGGGERGQPGVDGALPTAVRDTGAGEPIADGPVDQDVERVRDERGRVGGERSRCRRARPGRPGASWRRAPRPRPGRCPARRAASGRAPRCRPAPGSAARGRGRRGRPRTRRRRARARRRRRSAAPPPGRRAPPGPRRRRARPTPAARVSRGARDRVRSGRARGMPAGRRSGPGAGA